MYYSVSTGCYYDPSTQLLYEPTSGTYYRYNTETGSYEVHSQVEPNKGRKTRKPKRKSHAELRYSEEQGGYLLKDLQSQAGTSLNGVALEQGQESLVQHMDRLQLGAIELEAHIHKGTNTCTRCEPGLMDAPSSQQESQRASSPSSETKRRAQLKKLKAKYGLQGMEYAVKNPPRGYQDRAQERRGTVGSKFPHERESEPASVDRPLAQDNIGFKLLNKMGWKEGVGLGKHEQGATEPVKVSSKNTRTGLGHTGPKIEDQRTHILSKTRERYQAIADKEATATAAVLSPKQENT
uniref:G-patch domain-containing protein n=1 Tax=Amblyomma maculatum TaxID=34609 RepID=G3MRU7_AMBMU